MKLAPKYILENKIKIPIASHNHFIFGNNLSIKTKGAKTAAACPLGKAWLLLISKTGTSGLGLATKYFKIVTRPKTRTSVSHKTGMYFLLSLSDTKSTVVRTITENALPMNEIKCMILFNEFIR